MNRKAIIIGGSILGVVVVSGVAYLIIQTIKRSGIVKRLEEALKNPDSQDAQGGLNKLIASGVFNPNTYQKMGKATITLIEAREIAKRIWDAYSWFGSDQSTIVNAFNGLGHQNDVSKITHEFNESYDSDLAEVLLEALTDKAKANSLVAKINKLPKN